MAGAAPATLMVDGFSGADLASAGAGAGMLVAEDSSIRFLILTCFNQVHPRRLELSNRFNGFKGALFHSAKAVCEGKLSLSRADQAHSPLGVGKRRTRNFLRA